MRFLSAPEQALEQRLLLFDLHGQTLPDVQLVEANILRHCEVTNEIKHKLLWKFPLEHHVRNLRTAFQY